MSQGTEIKAYSTNEEIDTCVLNHTNEELISLFTIEILTNEERNSHRYINTGDIVFGDKHGIVISHNKQAYDDLTLFYGFDSLYDFYDAKEKVGV